MICFEILFVSMQILTSSVSLSGISTDVDILNSDFVVKVFLFSIFRRQFRFVLIFRAFGLVFWIKDNLEIHFKSQKDVTAYNFFKRRSFATKFRQKTIHYN